MIIYKNLHTKSSVFVLALGAKFGLKESYRDLYQSLANTNVKQLADLYDVLAKRVFKDRYFENDQRVNSANSVCFLKLDTRSSCKSSQFKRVI